MALIEEVPQEQFEFEGYQQPIYQYAPQSPTLRPLWASGVGLVGSGIGRPLQCSGIGMPYISGLGGRRPLCGSGVFLGNRFSSPPISPFASGVFSHRPYLSQGRSPVRAPCLPVLAAPRSVIHCSRPGMPLIRKPAPVAPQFQAVAQEVSYQDVPFERKVVEMVPVEHTIQDSYTVENRTSYVPVPALQQSVNLAAVNTLVPQTTNFTGEQTIFHSPQSPVSQLRKNLSHSNLFNNNWNNENIEFQQPASSRMFSPGTARSTFIRDNSSAVEGVRRGGTYGSIKNGVSLRKNKFDSLN